MNVLTIETESKLPVAIQRFDDLSREVYGVMGLTIDALDFRKLMNAIEEASVKTAPCLISTPNVNFLVTSRRNSDFRESLLRSNLCLADGMPLIWIAKLLGIPIRERVTGADLFESLKLAEGRRRRLRVFLFGGADGLAEMVCKNLNASNIGMECVGALYPGFGTIDEMSTNHVIDAINSSGADLLAVFLGAEKAQTWLLRNHDRIKIPVRAQFGAAINFEAGTIKRAPAILRNSGLEWLWRIKEEPYLWRRYWADGRSLLAMLFTHAFPLAVIFCWARLHIGDPNEGFSVDAREDGSLVVVSLSGSAIAQYIGDAADRFRAALASKKDIVIQCSQVQMVDPRFMGLLLMVRKQLVCRGQTLSFVEVPHAVRRTFRLNGFDFLLSNNG